MINQLIEILPKGIKIELPGEKLSLKPFVDYVRSIYDRASRQKQRFLSFVVKRIEYRLGSDLLIDPAKASEYADLWNLVYVCTNPILEEERNHFWALSLPVSSVFVYCTDALYETIFDTETGVRKNNLAELPFFEMHNDHTESCYSMILHRLYNIDTLFRKEIIFPFEEEAAGLTRYFRVHFDDRYINIRVIAYNRHG